MTTWQARLLAIGAWLVAICLALPFAALWDEYTTMRDGAAVTGHVTRTEPHPRYVDVTVGYDGGGRRGETHIYPPLKEAGSFKVGAKVALLVSGRGAFRPDYVEDQRPSILLVFGAALALVLGIVTWTAPSREAKRRAAWTSPLDVVIEGIRRTRNTAFTACGLFLAFAVFVFIVIAADGTASQGDVIGGVIVGILGVGLAGWFFAMGFRVRDPRRNPTMDLIEQRPGEIAWFYVQQTRGARTGVVVHDLLIWDTRGRHERIRMVPEDADALLAELARRAPHATRGYSPEMEKQYKDGVARARAAA